MDKDQKRKLEELKQKAKLKEQKQRLEKNVLLQECLAALGEYKLIESDKQTESIVRKASSPGAQMYSHDDPITIEDEEQYFITWDDASLPIVLGSGKNIRESWDDVMAVSFDTYLVAEKSGEVIGIRH